MRKALLTVLKAGLAFGVLGYLVYVVEPGAIGTALRRARPLGIVLAIALLPLNLALDGRAWGILLEPVTGRVPSRRLFGALMSGFALGFFTPARVGEYAGRAFYLRHDDKWTLGATIFTQRMLDMMVSVDLGLAALLYAIGSGVLPATLPWLTLACAGAAAGGTLTLLAFRPHWVDAALRRILPRAARVHRRTAFLRRLTALQMRRVLGWSTLRYGLFCTQFIALGWAFTPAASLTTLGLGVMLTFYVKFLVPSFTLMDLGIREGASVFFFTQLGLAPAAAFNAALLLFLINLALPSAAGVPFLWRLRWSRPVPPDGEATPVQDAALRDPVSIQDTPPPSALNK